MENKELARLVYKQAIAGPDWFDMGNWVAPEQLKAGQCGTTACLAGWTLLLHGSYIANGINRFENTETGERIAGSSIGNAAQELLGMSDEERYDHKMPVCQNDVFYMTRAPEKALARFKELIGDD